ncbi:MAG: response regulator transcription factor [Rhodospirillaceae bacterium]|nr:DNA-binding response regulator [Rhodospirillaceae bacterium]RPG04571.1 MAG: DNA-binding response regulator [Rhodospirillaceae bacterium TMED63]RZO37465.1 MAG: response regulator transcription factor [Rhodospirillaceae bacterium]
MVNGKRLLLVEDDNAIRETLRDQLQEEFFVVEATRGAEALKLAKASIHALIILDAGLPDMNGLDVCKLMRRAGINTPVIMLTGADTEADAVLGLDWGANDYVTKPFKMGLLLARIHAQLRQYDRNEGAIFTIGPYTFRPAAKIMIDTANGDRKIRLTEKETAILKYLFRAGETVIGRDVLLNEVWGYDSGVTTHTLETHVYRLRQKIERDPSNAEILITEPGGYRLIP